MIADEQFDVVVIGGGPAGLSAAAWCDELGLKAMLVEASSDIGGQLHRVYGPIRNYLGVSAADGKEMLGHFRRSVERYSFVRKIGAKVLSVDVDSKLVCLDNGEQIRYRCLIIATGVSRRMLGVEGETEFAGKGILVSGVKDRDSTAGRRVVIVGGGDAAIENAAIIADTAKMVTVVHRRAELTAREEFVRAIEGRENVSVELNNRVTAIVGDRAVTAVVVEEVASRASRTIAADAVLIRIGVEPNSDLVRGALERDARGYIKIGTSCECSRPEVFAVGDVANPSAPTLSSAIGMGASAAKACSDLLKRRSRDRSESPKI